MSKLWQESWAASVTYWTEHWKTWMGVLAAGTLWLWLLFIVAPGTVPFVFLEIEPINDPSVARTYHSQLMAVEHQLPRMLGVLVVASIIGFIVISQLLKRLRPSTPSGSTLGIMINSAIMMVISFVAMGAVHVPIDTHGSHGPMELRMAIVLVCFAIIVPWFFWRGALAYNHRPSFWSELRHRPKDLLFLPWTWLISVVVVQMASASFAWTTAVPAIGTFILALLTITSGILHQSVAYYYTRPGLLRSRLKKSS